MWIVDVLYLYVGIVGIPAFFFFQVNEYNLDYLFVGKAICLDSR